MKSKLMTALLAATLTASIFSGCSQSPAADAQTAGSETASDTAAANLSTDTPDTAQQDAADNSDNTSYTISIAQYAEHGSLDNCREGFILGLAAEGIVEGENLTINYQNAQADSGLSAQIADQFVSQDPDMICAIATPIALSCYNAAMDSEIPVIYTAITDPIAAQVATQDKMPVGNITGTSDKLPVDAQLQLIRDMLPEAKKIGILYTTSEVNSISTIEEYKEKAGDFGFEIVDMGISTLADLPMAVDSLLSKVDCINNLTDNTVVQGLPTVLAKANEKKIPVFGSEIEQVKNGCLAAAGIDYIELGKKTGEMAAKILKGEATANEMPYETFEDAEIYFNQAVADNLSIHIDSSVIEGAQIFTEINEAR